MPRPLRKCLKRTPPCAGSITQREELNAQIDELLAFELKNDGDAMACIDRLTLPVIATGLGDTRTLVIPVAHTIFWEMGAAKRAEMGIRDSLIRVSAGIEDTSDILNDFATALDT